MCGELGGVRREPLADRARPPVLPDDRPPARRAGIAVPGQHGLALVGEPDRVEARVARFGQRRTGGGEHALPQLLGVELDTAVGTGNDVDRHLGKCHHLAVVEHDRLRGRRPLIDREHGHAGSVRSFMSAFPSTAVPGNR